MAGPELGYKREQVFFTIATTIQKSSHPMLLVKLTRPKMRSDTVTKAIDVNTQIVTSIDGPLS